MSGEGVVRSEEGETPLRAGDSLVFPPGGAHQIINRGKEDLLYLVVADHPRADVIHYPDSGKWGHKPQHHYFHPEACDYYEGEE